MNIEEHKKRIGRKEKLIFALLAVNVLFIASLLILSAINSFFDANRLIVQYPVVVEVRSPILVEKREMLSPIASQSAEVATVSAELISQAHASEPEPTPTPELEERILKGEASYYSEDGCLGCSETLTMANGERLDDTQYTVALTPEMVSKYKLLNDTVRIYNPSQDRTVLARVTDTGGFGKYGRVADLSVASKEALGCQSLCDVEIYY